MTFTRLPLTVWSWLVSSSLTVIAFSALFIAGCMLLADRHCGTSFFLPPGTVINGIPQRDGSGSPMLWLHLFWFFGHPEVYITILPGMGLASSLLANFTRRPVPAYKFMVVATLLIGVMGLGVWGHHMFVSGMNPYAGTAFGLTTIAISVPSSAEVLTWLAMLFRGRLRLTTPMLFTLGFISFFIAGGLTGPILAQPALDAYLHNTFFVVAHFHLVMAMAGVFSLFAGIYYWYPLLTGRRMNEALGNVHFWISLIAAYGAFFPMHFAGLAGEPRHYAQLTGPVESFANLIHVERGITWSAFLLAAAQLIFLFNFFRSIHPRRLRRPKSLASHHPRVVAHRASQSQHRPLRLYGPGTELQAGSAPRTGRFPAAVGAGKTLLIATPVQRSINPQPNRSKLLELSLGAVHARHLHPSYGRNRTQRPGVRWQTAARSQAHRRWRRRRELGLQQLPPSRPPRAC
jgi:heme/copper-type cytochrome/quinol oxidase subunit 1